VKPILILALAATAGSASPDRVDSVSLALARGMAAEASGNGRALLESARQLESFGAHAAEGEEDLAVHWRALARTRGVKDSSPPLRGRALGPAYRRGRLGPGAALATEQVFLAGQKAIVALVPEPGRRLSMRVAAPDKAICDLAAQAPRVACAWLPLFTTRVKINIANQGTSPASYYLVSN
jgi:hypothetical protein